MVIRVYIMYLKNEKGKMNFLLHRKIAICMLFIALTGLGYVSYKQLPVEAVA